MGHRTSRSAIDEDLSINDYRYLMKQTKLKPEVIQSWYREFRNVCPNGQLNKYQFKRFYYQLTTSSERNLDSITDNVFRTFDRDGNHHIDFKEFLIAFTLTSIGDPVEKLNYTFSLFDQDRSETIEPNEMLDLLTKLFSITGHPIAVGEIQLITDDIFRKFDTDQNQIISKEEFIDGCLKHNAIHQILSPF